MDNSVRAATVAQRVTARAVPVSSIGHRIVETIPGSSGGFG